MKFNALTMTDPVTNLLEIACVKPTKTSVKTAHIDRIPSTNPGAEPPRDAKDSGSARSHSTHLETSSSYRP